MQNDDKGKPTDPDYSPEAVLGRIRKMGAEEPPTLRIPGWLAVVVLIAIVAAVGYWYQGLGVPDIPLCVVNTSSDVPLTVYLDGKVLGTAPRMVAEDPTLAVMGVLEVGDHMLEARGVSDAVVASEKVVVDKNSNGFLWTPLPDPSASFLIQTTDYGESTGGAGWFPLEVNDDDEYPWLVREKRFIRDFIQSDKPVLGICLGAQLIACALGARVYKNTGKGIGWFPVKGIPATDKTIFNFPASEEVFHWHGETFDLPAGAIRLAASRECENQAFQSGRSVIGLQSVFTFPECR